MTSPTKPPASWPTGHIGWVFAGTAEFQGRVATFLAEGGAQGERLMFVADDPRPELWPRTLIDEGQLVILSTSEIYGADRAVVARTQRATFMATLERALADGYKGLRVAADNTSLIEDPERLAAWMLWEEQADQLMQSHPITGLCAFDRARADADSLSAVMAVHGQLPPSLSIDERAPAGHDASTGAPDPVRKVRQVGRPPSHNGRQAPL
ncbi:MAG TPA: MEDS domain-containing protein [Acidimicrobiales bacterium]|nr:MEDS domain-containing protein [Acidimicrobiales bacterium]